MGNLAEASNVKTASPTLKPLGVTVPDALRISGVGRSTLYKLIRERKLESVLIYGRRIINFASLERLTSARDAPPAT
jgi:hypothetical protein